MTKLKILLLGSSGFIGQNIVDEFEDLINFELLAADVVLSKYVRPRKFQKVDLAVESEITQLCNEFKPDIIINLAARTDLLGSSEMDYLCNLKIVKNLEKILTADSSVKLIHFSSMLADPCFTNSSNDPGVVFYGRSKYAGEEVLLSLDEGVRSRVTIVRPTSIWGRYFHEPYIEFFRLVMNRRYVNIGHERYKSFGYVGTVIAQVIQIINHWPDDRVYIVGDPEPYEIEAFSNEIAEAFSVRRPRVVPKFFLQLVSWCLSNVCSDHKNPLPRRRLNNLLNPICYAPKTIKYAHFSRKVDVSEAIRDTVLWMKE